MHFLETRLYTAFASGDGGGNVAAVVYDDVGLTSTQRQRLASVLSVPTTGFVKAAGDSRFDVRFFSTRSEMAMCGHVTVAIFASLSDDGRLTAPDGRYRQVTPAGEVQITVTKAGGRPYVSMRQNQPVFGQIHAGKDEIAPLLGTTAEAVVSMGSCSTGLRHLFVQLPDGDALGAIKPDDRSLVSFSKERSIDTIGVWCLKNSQPGCAFVRVRDLCHGVGDAEEAASGTTNGALACHLWKEKIAEAGPNGELAMEAEQGFEMGRPSRLTAHIMVSGSSVSEVTVGGKARRWLTGRLEL